MYTIRTQVQLVFALTAVHNFMNSHGHNPEEEAESNPIEYEESEVVQPDSTEAVDDTSMGIRREDISGMIWEDYEAY